MWKNAGMNFSEGLHFPAAPGEGDNQQTAEDQGNSFETNFEWLLKSFCLACGSLVNDHVSTVV